MRRLNRRSLVATLAAASCVSAPARAGPDGLPDFFELPVEGMERLSPTLWVKLLTPGVWITCFTFNAGSYGVVPANGLIIAAEPGPTIVDTGCNAEQGALLLSTTERLTGRPAVQAIATHFHSDRTGGIEAMRAANVPVFAHPYSVGLAQAYDMPVPTPVRGLEKGPVALGPVELFYPGAGHTRDNITAWHAESRTLFGGCLVRATTDTGIGSVGDADLSAYSDTIAHLVARYPERAFTIPGHGSIAGDALTWTQGLAAALVNESARP